MIKKFRKRKISISISEELLKRIQTKAEKLDISVSACISLVLKGDMKL